MHIHANCVSKCVCARCFSLPIEFPRALCVSMLINSVNRNPYVPGRMCIGCKLLVHCLLISFHPFIFLFFLVRTMKTGIVCTKPNKKKRKRDEKNVTKNSTANNTIKIRFNRKHVSTFVYFRNDCKARDYFNYRSWPLCYYYYQIDIKIYVESINVRAPQLLSIHKINLQNYRKIGQSKWRVPN